MSDKIERKRGDTKPWVFKLWENKKENKPLDITGFTFRITVNVKADPISDILDPPVFSLVGVIFGTPENGTVRGLPSEVQMDLDPEIEWFYDFEVTDADGFIDTPIIDKLKITQDLSK